jgi:hypothetical protein
MKIPSNRTRNLSADEAGMPKGGSDPSARGLVAAGRLERPTYGL